MTRTDRDLGMDRPITRRDFLNGVSLTVGGVLLSPAFSAAWLFRFGGVGRLRGTATDGRSMLLHDRIGPEDLRPLHRTNAYKLLLGQRFSGEPGAIRLTPPDDVVVGWCGGRGASPTRRAVVDYRLGALTCGPRPCRPLRPWATARSA